MRLVATLPLVMLIACDGAITTSPLRIANYFPFDGERTWEFTNTDEAIEHRLYAVLDPEPLEGDGAPIHRISYSECPGSGECDDTTLVREIHWSNDSVEGIQIWGYETPSGKVDFDPPIFLSFAHMDPGESAVTTTGGADWTGTFHGLDTCPVTWTTQWGDSCLRFSLEGGSGADAEHLAGEYWAITQYNVVAIDLDAEPGIWQLSYATWEGN